MHLRLSLISIFVLLVNGLARADELERTLPVAGAVAAELAQSALPADPTADPGRREAASFAHSLDVRAGEVLDRSAALAAARAIALLEARGAEPDEAARRAAARVERQLTAASAREAPRRRLEGAVLARRRADPPREDGWRFVRAMARDPLAAPGPLTR